MNVCRAPVLCSMRESRRQYWRSRGSGTRYYPAPHDATHETEPSVYVVPVMGSVVCLVPDAVALMRMCCRACVFGCVSVVGRVNSDEDW